MPRKIWDILVLVANKEERCTWFTTMDSIDQPGASFLSYAFNG
jgi:hypothetical protein